MAIDEEEHRHDALAAANGEHEEQPAGANENRSANAVRQARHLSKPGVKEAKKAREKQKTVACKVGRKCRVALNDMYVVSSHSVWFMCNG
jgi:hypothetical protein